VVDTYRPITLARGIRAAAARWPDRIAIADDDVALSYRQLSARMARAANAAAGLGLVAGDRVALVAGNTPYYIEVVAGLSEAGVIVATLSTRLTAAELLGIFDDCTPRLAITDAYSDAVVAAAAPTLPRIRLDDGWSDLLARASDRWPEHPIRETDSFAMSYTSGTTGKPKGVLLSHRSRCITFLAMAGEYGCFGPGQRFLAVTPMAHGAGFSFAAAALFHGGTTILAAPSDPERLSLRLAEPDLHGVFVVPTILSRLLDLPPRALGANLRTMISNAAALAPSLKEAAVARWGNTLLHETYGSTEAGIVTNMRPDQLLAKPASVGTPFPLIEISLRDSAGEEVADDMPGELFARGPYAFNGYWQRPEATAEAVRDGWITVGDLATRDKDGFITIMDRLKDMIVSGGLNIYPREIELVLSTLPGIRDVAVIGLADRDWGERVHAVLVGDATPAAIAAALEGQLATYKHPKSFSTIAELPRNASGKILKRELRQQLSAES
jgi:long-chain acyl-CoA synthetase